MWKAVEHLLSEQLGRHYGIQHKVCLKKQYSAEIWLITDHHCPVLVKSNERAYRSMFRAQADQLELLARTNLIPVPKTYGVGCSHNHSFLLLQGLTLTPPNIEQLTLFGQKLAHQHQWYPQEKYGLDFDTWLGEVYQPNEWHNHWGKFFSEQRIGWQLQICKEKNIYFGDIDKIISQTEKLLAKHHPRPALLHGNLNTTNFAWCTEFNQIVTFDPACYWGDYECDLALLELTHLQSAQIIQGYKTIQDIDSGYINRRQVYQFYYLLNFSQRFQNNYVDLAQQQLKQLFD